MPKSIKIPTFPFPIDEIDYSNFDTIQYNGDNTTTSKVIVENLKALGCISDDCCGNAECTANKIIEKYGMWDAEKNPCGIVDIDFECNFGKTTFLGGEYNHTDPTVFPPPLKPDSKYKPCGGSNEGGPEVIKKYTSVQDERLACYYIVTAKLAHTKQCGSCRETSRIDPIDVLIQMLQRETR
jgi:hypothetical protein